MQGSPIRDKSAPNPSASLLLAAGVACALALAASTASAEPRRARVEPRTRAYSEHQVPRHDRDRHDNHSHRRDTFGWYGTPSRSYCSPNSTVVLSGGFGATILYDRWGRRCDNPYYAYCGPTSLYTYRYGYTRYGYSPSYRYTLVDVDPDLAATQQRIGTPTSGVSDNDFHTWQLAQRDAARAAAAADSTPTQSTAAYRPGAPSVSTSPTAITKGTPASPSAEAVKPDPPRAEPLSTTETSAAWKALEEGRLLEAQSLFARGADAPVMPGAADHRAALSAGFAITATMLNREEAAAWALRRAFDLDPEVATRFPWTDALREMVREAARRISELHAVQPTQDRALLLKRLNTLTQ